MKKINFLLIISYLLVSCGGLGDAGKVLRNEKIRGTDEFFVKKKEPLELPPEYDKLPAPGSIKDNTISEEDRIKKILKTSKDEKALKQKPSSIETDIIKKIRK